jgi:group I intron endonuclease
MIIYKTTNLINGKFYIGQDHYDNPNYLGSGLLLNRAIKKYGRENFKKETIEVCINQEQLNIREKFWISELKSTTKNIGYNIALGGTGGDTFSGASESEKKRRGKKLSESYYKNVITSKKFLTRGSKISASKKGAVFSQEHKNNLSLSHIGKSPWNKNISDPECSERKKIKIGNDIVQLILKLYDRTSPCFILSILRDFGVLSVSSWVIRRVLKENKKYIENDIRFRVGSHRHKLSFPIVFSDVASICDNDSIKIKVLVAITNAWINCHEITREEALEIAKQQLQ